jgi:hypothetical protein
MLVDAPQDRGSWIVPFRRLFPDPLFRAALIGVLCAAPSGFMTVDYADLIRPYPLPAGDPCRGRHNREVGVIDLVPRHNVDTGIDIENGPHGGSDSGIEPRRRARSALQKMRLSPTSRSKPRLSAPKTTWLLMIPAPWTEYSSGRASIADDRALAIVDALQTNDHPVHQDACHRCPFSNRAANSELPRSGSRAQPSGSPSEPSRILGPLRRCSSGLAMLRR